MIPPPRLYRKRDLKRPYRKYLKYNISSQDTKMQSLNYEPISLVSNIQNILKFFCSLN